MKLLLAASAALATLAGFGTTAVHADTSPLPDPGSALQCIQGAGAGIPVTCWYCATVSGLGPITISYGTDAAGSALFYNVMNVLYNGTQVCTESPIGHL